MPVSATSIASIPVQALAALVAASSTFQTITESADAAAALGHVYYLEAEDRRTSESSEIPATRPRAIISAHEHGAENQGLAHWSYSGNLELTLQAEVPSDFGGTLDNEKDEALWWANTYGAILAEMVAAIPSAPQTYLNLKRWDVIGEPWKIRHGRGSRAAYWEVVLRMEWVG